jgi:type III pantothenate kinase
MNLLIDIGNTRLKWCLEEKGRFEKVHPIEYKAVAFEKELHSIWSQIKSPCLLAISSVSEKVITTQVINIAKKLWPLARIFIAKSTSIAFSVSNAYKQPESLGVDRWLGLIALHHYYPGNSCIASCGSAITVDCLDKTGEHLGGVISPGLQLMKQSLQQKTEKLPYVSQQYTVGLSNCTESGIYSGTLYAATGLIKKIYDDFYTCKTLVLTGGDAMLIAQSFECNTLKNNLIIEPDFVLKGLSLYCSKENVL